MITVSKIEKVVSKFPRSVIIEFCKTILRREGYIIRDPSEMANMRARASKKKVEEIQKKIEKAVKKMKEENKNLSIYSVAKYANISWNTAKKYSYLWEDD